MLTDFSLQEENREGITVKEQKRKGEQRRETLKGRREERRGKERRLPLLFSSWIPPPGQGLVRETELRHMDWSASLLDRQNRK